MRLNVAVFLTLTLVGCGTVEQATTNILPASSAHPPKALQAFSPTADVRLLWQANAGRGSGKDYVRINPHVDDNLIFVAGGNALWEATLSIPQGTNDFTRMTDVDGKLKAQGAALFAASYNGQIAGIDMRNGNIGWSAPYSSYTGVDAAPNGLYTTNAIGDLWKLNPQSGTPLWKMDDLEYRQPTAPTVVGNYLVVGDAEGYLHWVNASSGQLAARSRGDSAGYIAAPIQDGNVVYTLGRGGVLSAFGAQ